MQTMKQVWLKVRVSPLLKIEKFGEIVKRPMVSIALEKQSSRQLHTLSHFIETVSIHFSDPGAVHAGAIVHILEWHCYFAL
jgi:hypothetical protein